MKIFNKLATCPKCGSGDIGTHYSEGASVNSFDYIARGIPSCEHLVRICPRCDFSWFERPLDSVWAKEQQA